MSFRKNDNQQISFNDSTFGLTEREIKALDHSWAKSKISGCSSYH